MGIANLFDLLEWFLVPVPAGQRDVAEFES